jgi:hypothetical protein
MEEERKAVRTMREFVNWYESTSTYGIAINSKLHEFYIKFKYIVDQEPLEKPLIIEKKEHI